MTDNTYGHTPSRKAFEQMDVYGIGYDEERAARPKVRLAIIGGGGVAQSKYFPAIARLRMIWEPIELVAFAEPRVDQASKVQEVYGVRWYSDLLEMLAEEQIDGVLVLSPDDLHAEHTIAAFEAGCHVLVEKPIARSLADAEKMCQFAQTKGLTLMTVANKRFSPPYRHAKKVVEQWAAPAMFVGKFNLGYDYVDLLEGGTIHLFDLARYFMGDVAALTALGVNKYRRSKRIYPFDNAIITCEFRSGAIGTLYTSSSALSFKPWERVEIYGDHAWLSVEDQSELLVYDAEEGPARSWKPVVPNTLLFDEEFGGYMGLIENFAQVIRGREQPFVTGQDGLRALELAVATHLSLDRRARVTLPVEIDTADHEMRAWLKVHGWPGINLTP
jgi:UDP-N-acetylglucosamine 3-dehydrogenase